jgi:hypothetical protein
VGNNRIGKERASVTPLLRKDEGRHEDLDQQESRPSSPAQDHESQDILAMAFR